MKDAFGGAFMIKVFLVFIIIYICFTALALNYAKAFKVKNAIIEYIESKDEVNFSDLNAQEFTNMEDFFMKEIYGNMNYYGHVKCNGGPTEIYCKNGIKVEKKSDAINTEGTYYKVSTTFGWGLDFMNLNRVFHTQNTIGNWTISGETKVIVNDE